MLKSCAKCGKLHDFNYRCKAGQSLRRARSTDQRLRSTNKWTEKSREIREASNWLCAICKQEGKYNYDDVEVHHITKLRHDEQGLLDNYNLICLCKYHHELADSGKISADELRELARCREEN